jgi:hypothetical protein
VSTCRGQHPVDFNLRPTRRNACTRAMQSDDTYLDGKSISTAIHPVKLRDNLRLGWHRVRSQVCGVAGSTRWGEQSASVRVGFACWRLWLIARSHVSPGSPTRTRLRKSKSSCCWKNGKNMSKVGQLHVARDEAVDEVPISMTDPIPSPASLG